MEEESISDASNVTTDTFSHTPNTQRENANTLFTSENLDKSDDMAGTLKILTIKNAGYYASKSATASDAQGDLTCDLKTVTDTSNMKEKITDTSNGNYEQKLLINRTLPVVVLMTKPRIEDRIAPIVGDSQAILTPVTKEVVAYAACGGAWVNQNL